MATNPSNRQPYGSARDLPSFQEIDRLLLGARVWAVFGGRDMRRQFAELKAQSDAMVDTVDRFYEVIGSRNWIFHNTMNPDVVATLLDKASDPDEIEQGLINMYRDEDVVKHWIFKLCHQPLLKERAHQIRRAHKHLMVNEFDSCVLQLIAVMDGYVSDLEPGSRRGLHARQPDDLVAWDSVVGHHLGLTHVLKTFLKPIGSRIDEPVQEVYRHGIVHGMVVNFDHAIVACKAWNMLFALNDWAVSLENEARPVTPDPSLREVWGKLARNARYKRAQREFVASRFRVGDPDFEEIDVVVAAREFLEAWQRGQWGIVARFIPTPLSRSMTDRRAAGFAKEYFERFDLTKFEVVECSSDGPSGAGIISRVTCNGTAHTIRFRMIYWTDDDRVGLPSEGDGSWRAQPFAPDVYFRDSAA